MNKTPQHWQGRRKDFLQGEASGAFFRGWPERLLQGGANVAKFEKNIFAKNLMGKCQTSNPLPNTHERCYNKLILWFCKS